MSHNGLSIDVALLTNVNVLASALNKYEAMYAEVPPARMVKLTMPSVRYVRNEEGPRVTHCECKPQTLYHCSTGQPPRLVTNHRMSRTDTVFLKCGQISNVNLRK